MASTTECDSESEDAPREILDLAGDFTLPDATTGDSCPVSFKLQDFNPTVKDQRTGQFIPLGNQALLAIRPVPGPEAVLRSRKAMCNNWIGVWTGTKFQPPKDSSGVDLSPGDVFAPRKINSIVPGVHLERFCLRRRFCSAAFEAGLKTMCIYMDGAGVDSSNTPKFPTLPHAFVFDNSADDKFTRPPEQHKTIVTDGQAACMQQHTIPRAELRAILAALTYRAWWVEGWQRIVLVTPSGYVASNATGTLRLWAERNWRTAAGRTVGNRDLWEELSRIMGTYAVAGCEISFWAVPEKANDTRIGVLDVHGRLFEGMAGERR